MFLKKVTKKGGIMMEVEAWEEFKNKNKKRAEEIEALCRKISAEWPAAIVLEKEREEITKKILLSSEFKDFKEEIESIRLKTPFASSGDMGMLVLSQLIAAGSITR